MNKIFLNLGKQPLANNFQKKITTNYYNLHVRFNVNTKLVSINKKIKKELMFDKKYPYRSSQSKTVHEHFKKLSYNINKNFWFKNILEIGSNDGSFAQNFSKDKIVCVEPCKDVGNELKKKKFKVYTEYFDDKLKKKLIKNHYNFDLIFSANTITHINGLDNTLKRIKKLLSKNGVFILEEPSFLQCLKKNAFDQFYNEHIYVLSALSLKNILKKVKLKIFKIEKINLHGGSLRYFITHISNKQFKVSKSFYNQIRIEKKNNLDKLSTYIKFAKKVYFLKNKLIKIFKYLRVNKKKIIGYGASAKAVTVVNFCKLKENFFEYFLDTTKHKEGKYLPGTKIIVKKYNKKKMDHKFYYFLGAWNFKTEIFKKEKFFLQKGGSFILHLPNPKIYNNKLK